MSILYRCSRQNVLRPNVASPKRPAIKRLRPYSLAQTAAPKCPASRRTNTVEYRAHLRKLLAISEAEYFCQLLALKAILIC